MPESSFLPDEYLAERSEKRVIVICLLLFAIVLGGMFGVDYFVKDQLRVAEQANREVREKERVAAKRLDQLDEYESRNIDMNRKAEIIAQLLERLPRSRVLAELTNNMPPALSLIELDLQTRVIKVAPPRTEIDKAKKKIATRKKDDAPKPVQAERREIELALVGIAPTDVQVAKFMTELQRNPLFKELNLKYSQETRQREQTLRRFRIDMIVDAMADAEAYEPSYADSDRLPRNPLDSRIKIDTNGFFSDTIHLDQTGEDELDGLEDAGDGPTDTRRSSVDIPE